MGRDVLMVVSKARKYGAEHATGAPYVRHPSHGGAEVFHQGLARLL